MVSVQDEDAAHGPFTVGLAGRFGPQALVWRSACGDKVVLRHNGSIATMKRKAFKELLAAIRAVRPKRRRPSLRLVVSNPVLSIVNVKAA